MPRTQFLRLAPLGLICLAAAAQAELKFVSNEPVILRDGVGAATFVLTNAGAAAVPLNLTTGTFIDETSHAKLLSPKVTFALEAGGGNVPAQIGPGQSLQVVASVSNLSGSSAADTKIFNGAAQVGSLTAVAVDVPLNVTLDENGTPDKPLQFEYGRSTVISMKNGGKDFLTLDWRFLVGGTVVGGTGLVMHGPGNVVRITPPLTLVPNGHSRIVFSPPREVYSWKDFFRPTSRSGVLLLRQHAPPGVAMELLTSQPVPVTLTMMRLGPDATEALFAIYVMVFLLIGGLLSLTGSSVLPNILRKVALRRQITALADRTSSVSTRVDSYLRVLLRLERGKIRLALGEVGPLSLSSAEKFDDVTVAIDRLGKRLAVAERLDELHRCFEQVSATAPPSITEAIDANLQAASKQMHSYALADEEVAAANRILAKADAALDMLDDDVAQAKLIAANFKQLKERLAAFPAAYYTDLKLALPGIFGILESPFDDPANIVRPMFFAIDHAIAAAQTALDYAMVRATLPAADSPICSAPSKLARDRLLAHECELISLLGTLSWKSLRAAITLVRQMREDTYENDVLLEIGKKRADGEKRVRVVSDTQKTRPFLPVFFTIDFDDPRFDSAAALDWLSFRWSFPSGLIEEGSKVCHYFLGTEARTIDGNKVKIVVSVQSQRNPEAADTIEGAIELQRPKVHRSSRAFAEAVRFLIAFGVALASLEAGALDQLAKLDFLPATIAVVGLGFGADSIKNLLTQAPKKTNG